MMNFKDLIKFRDICIVKNDFNKSVQEDENNNIDVENSIDSSENSSDLEIENAKI